MSQVLMEDKINVGYSEQCSKNNIIFINIGIQRRCRNNNIIITTVGPTIIYMTDGSSRPYSPSVRVRCKMEDVKLISGSIRWLIRSQCDVWHFVSFARRSTSEGILMMFPKKLNPQEFLLFAMKKYWLVHLSWNSRRSPSTCFCFNTAISNSTCSTEKIMIFCAKTRLIFTSLLYIRQIAPLLYC